jgi:cation diffusion facilitator family transporter
VVDKPADKGHQYGHGKIETLTGAICGVLLLLAGIGIFYSGASKIGCFIRGTVIPRPGLVAFFAALVSVVSKEILFRYTRRVAERITSSALKAQAWHHRSDAMSSLAVLAGLGGAVFLGSEWVILDPLAALLVSFFIARIAFQILKETLNELIEGSLDGDAGTAIWELMSSTRGVYNVHNVRSRKIGHYFAVEAHVMVDKNLSLLEAHHISSVIEKKIYAKYGEDTLVTIHVEPGPKSRQPNQNI